MSNNIEQVRMAAGRVNESLLNYIISLPDGNSQSPAGLIPAATQSQPNLPASKVPRPTLQNTSSDARFTERSTAPESSQSPEIELLKNSREQKTANLDWEATVNALTLQFLNDHETTRVAALNWLIMLHRKAPAGRKLEINDGTFPALLKTLSDASEAVVTRDLVLLSQMSRNTDDPTFSTFMVNLLNLFATDRKLLENRGNLIIRQLCISLNPERIFRTLADCLDKEEDVEFASIMVQNLNNNLITAPELADLRKRLRNLESREGQAFFVALFRSWCHNAVATFSLCLLAQAYEQAYQLLQIFAELDMTVHMLIQIDKLVQLLESPVFTC
jgi:vacuole morphology and inheritance protein 14